MSSALRQPMTQDQFFRWAEGRAERWEFDGFQPVAMTGGSRNHARITGNINALLRQSLDRDSPCEALSSDAAIETINNGVRYPDLLVTCTASNGRDRLIPGPVIVSEVVGPSSTREDRILEPRDQAGVASIRRDVIVEQAAIGVTASWQEEDEPWRFETLLAGDTLRPPEISVELPEDELCSRVTFDEPQNGDHASG